MMGTIIKNPWIVGIITGVISGVIIYISTNLLAKKLGKEEYYKRVDVANKSVLALLKSFIAEQGLPNIVVFKAIINATANDNSIKVDDMYSIKLFCEETVRDILADAYISSEQRKNYSNMLSNYITDFEEGMCDNDVMESENRIVVLSKLYRKRLSIFIASAFSILTMLMSLIVVFDQTYDESHSSFWYPFDEHPIVWLPIMIATVLFLVLFIWVCAGKMFDSLKMLIMVKQDVVAKEKHIKDNSPIEDSNRIK